MIQIPYEPRLDVLLHAGRQDDFFTYSSFAQGHFPSEAALCIEMSRLAYVKEKNRLVEYLKRASFALVDAVNYNLQVSPMQYFIAEKSSGTGQPIVVVAFRGSEIEDYKDVTTDIGIIQDTWGGKGKVHTGFSKALPEAEI